MEDRIAALRARVAGMGPAERAALRSRVEAAGIDWARVAPPETVAERPARLPLSPAQMQFWLTQQVRPDSAAFTIAFAWEVDGPLDRAALARALGRVVARHETLRTGFPAEEGVPWQEIAEQLAVPFEEVRPDDVAADAAAFTARPFDLATPPLLRARVQILGAGRHRVLFAFHHIVADGWSRGVFMEELAAFYRAETGGVAFNPAPLPQGYADLVLAGRDWLEGPGAGAEAAFWRAELAGLPPQELPARAVTADRRAGTCLRRLDPALAARIAPAAARMGVSPFVLLLAIFQLLLHRVSGQDDIAVGTPSAGREAPEAAGTIGLFMDTLVLRNRLRAYEPFAQWVARVGRNFARAFDHRRLPFARIVEAAGAARQADRTPLFQTLFQVQGGSYGRQNAEAVDLGDPRLAVRQEVLPLPEAKFDLSWHVMEQPDGLAVIVEYRAALFDADLIEGMVGQFETLAANALDTPQAAVGALDFVPPEAAEAAILRGPERPIPPLERLLVPRAAEALVDTATGAVWSGAEIDAAATRLARILRARPELAEPGARIAICLPRGPGLVVAMLAALKAGIPYVPLDPGHPAARRDAILADARPGLMLAAAGTAAPCPVLDPAEIGEGAAGAALPEPDPEAPAYLIFTSGSTGRPKGVEVPRRALANLLAAMAERPGLAPGDRLLALTTVAFDIAALEILLPLAAGATLVLADAQAGGAPDRLADLIEGHGISHVQAVPATWRLLLDHGWPGRAGLTALSGGEALPGAVARDLRARVGAVWNMYGPTETTIWSAALPVGEDRAGGAPVPLGGALANTDLRVLDGYGAVLPPGVPGELAIGGAGLALGYRKRPDLTAARFPVIGGERLYLTGDRVRLEADGTLAYLGRLDHQIKLNGHRIEPGEVEAVLAAAPGVEAALVLSDGARLVAYAQGEGLVPEALRRTVAERLPGYMVPAAIVPLAAFPLTPNGKIDRARLTLPGRAEAEAGRGPEGAAETLLAGIWAEVLERERVGAEENFFDLGGASVSAMRIAARARAQGLLLTPAQMFEHQTVAAQAAAATRREAETLPLSPWQAAHRADAGDPHRVRLAAEAGWASRLADALAAVHAAHPALRLSLAPDGWRTESAAAPTGGASEIDAAGPLWRARVVGAALEVVAHPLLLDRGSVERLAGQIAAVLRGGTADPGGDGYLRWLAGGPRGPAPRLAPLPAMPEDGADAGAGPVTRHLDAAGLRALRARAEARNATPGQLIAAALANTLGAWAGGGPVSLALVEEAPAEDLGCYTRVMPVRIAAGPGGVGAALDWLVEALHDQDPRGVDPRGLPEGLVVVAPGGASQDGGRVVPAPALTLGARPCGDPGGLDLIWQADPARLSRRVAERLAARHLADLAPTARGEAGAGKLDRLRARLTEPGR